MAEVFSMDQDFTCSNMLGKKSRVLLYYIQKKISHKRWEDATYLEGTDRLVVSATRDEITAYLFPHTDRNYSRDMRACKEDLERLRKENPDDPMVPESMTVTNKDVTFYFINKGGWNREDLQNPQAVKHDYRVANQLSTSAGKLYDLIRTSFDENMVSNDTAVIYFDLIDLRCMLGFIDMTHEKIASLLKEYEGDYDKRKRLELRNRILEIEKDDSYASFRAYGRFNNFRAKVLEAAKEEIEKTQGYDLSIESIKNVTAGTHGTVIGVSLTVKKRSPYQDADENMQLALAFSDGEEPVIIEEKRERFKCPLHFRDPINERTWNDMLFYAGGSVDLIRIELRESHKNPTTINDVGKTYDALKRKYGKGRKIVR